MCLFCCLQKEESPSGTLLMISLRFILKVLSRILYINAFAFILCAGVAIIYNESTLPYLYAATATILPGVILHLVTQKKEKEYIMRRQGAYLTVTLSWIIICLTGTLPYIFTGGIVYFPDAFFETVSGFTTTGASILRDIEVLPYSLLFWRSLTHWIGGIGIIVLVILIMPSLQTGGYQLFTLESSVQTRIKPHIKSIGIRLFLIYVILTVAEIILLMLGKMNLFESTCHAFGTVATGGFSPKNTSIAGYSPYIQYVITLFMILAGTNFVVHYYLLKREFQKVKQNEELRFYLLVLIASGLFLTGSLYFEMNKPLELSFREAFFQIVSIVTCTGFATTDYLLWPVYAWYFIFIAMFFGGCTGSTAGGIKMVRHLVLFKNIKRVIRKYIYPNEISCIKLNNTKISSITNNSILTFIFVYFIIFLIGTLSLVILNIDGKSAASAVATCMAGIGPGIGTVGPVSNFYHLPALGKIILSALMIIGRLEIYTVILLFTRSFWSK